jgi:phosphohistidine phosphatase
MRLLMLLRHAKTERTSPSGQDRDRQLNAVGRADAPAIGQYVASHKLAPDFALVSPAARARETFDLFAAELSSQPPCEIVHDLYGADPGQLLRIVRMATAFSGGAAADRLMVVAHNPGLHEFALALTHSGGHKDREHLADNLPTGGLALIDFDIADWADLSFASGRLRKLIRPSTLREKSE